MGSITNILLLIFFIFFFQSALSKKVLPLSSSTSGCIESERKALLEFKASLLSNDYDLPGENASSLSSWTGRDCCTWDGITCHNLTGRIQVLNLDENSLNSPLSPWLFNLTQLEVLQMSDSGLIGPIPNMFDKLPFLTTLDLSGNNFNSSISSSFFNLTRLEVFKMSGSGLIGPMPNTFHKLTSLIHLDLSRNSFDSAVFPDSLCSLTSLTIMQLDDLKGSLPSCLGNLTSLTALNFRGNELSGEIPSGLGNLMHLTTLDLSNNHFNSSIPSSFGNLQDLESLNLAYNHLSGVIPSTLRNLTKLKQLHVNDNSLTGELSESIFDGLKSLEELDMSKNRYLVFNVSPQWIPPFQMSSITVDSVFIGTQFPPWLQTQTNLKELFMSNVSIYGAIPGWCSTAFPNLTDFDLSYNLLTGSIPAFDVANLENLKLTGNKLSGEIPQQLCNLMTLQGLSLAKNQVTGRIPSCLGALQRLTVLDLGNNRLSGDIPNELGSLQSLWVLHLNGNKLSGKLPGSWEHLGLTTLDLGDNNLQGYVPEWIGNNFSGLSYLRIESNNFSGEIPVSLCRLPQLLILNLAHNNFVGTIPPCLGNLSMKVSNPHLITAYRVAGFPYNEAVQNTIKGNDLEYTSNLPNVVFMSLSSNRLHGEIPVEFMDLKRLRSLNLSNNELTGRIPNTINNLKQLESLDLSMNRISGIIPQTLADIDALGYLNLSFNNLEGRIPSGNHFDTLVTNESLFKGNMGLCGKILMKSCPGDDQETSVKPNGPASASDDEFHRLPWLYAGIGPGFAIGFLGVICTLYFKDRWRIAYFGFVDNMYNKLWVHFTIKISQLRSKFN